MAVTKLERINNIENEIRQLENQRKQLLQQHKEQERKERTHRLCKRGGLLESILPDTITLTDEQFKMFLEKTLLNDNAHKMFDSIAAQTTVTVITKSTGTANDSIADDSRDGKNEGSMTG